jgi:hypothetical protein
VAGFTGADTSLENNNVFGIEPRMYLETGEELIEKSDGSKKVGHVLRPKVEEGLRFPRVQFITHPQI